VLLARPAVPGAEPQPQTHFDASAGLKTHLVAASFSFPQHFFPPGLDAPVPKMVQFNRRAPH